METSLTNPLTLALISDLHSCRYKDNQKELIDALDSASPDLILLAGDIFDDELDNDATAIFLQEIVKRYPIYYVTGNHEYWGGSERFDQQMTILKELGVRRLSGESTTININNETILLSGLDDPEAYWVYPSSEQKAVPSFDKQLSDLKSQNKKQYYSILLSHRPERFEEYANSGYDLALCGHAHGGQWRIPGLINGLLAPNQGIFPKYAGGLYRQNSFTMIVSRGLAKESTRVPRFHNHPEIVIIHLY